MTTGSLYVVGIRLVGSRCLIVDDADKANVCYSKLLLPCVLCFYYCIRRATRCTVFTPVNHLWSKAMLLHIVHDFLFMEQST